MAAGYGIGCPRGRSSTESSLSGDGDPHGSRSVGLHRRDDARDLERRSRRQGAHALRPSRGFALGQVRGRLRAAALWTAAARSRLGSRLSRRTDTPAAGRLKYAQ